MPDTAIELKFGNGEYRFWLPMRELVQLERECNKSALQMHDEMGLSLGRHPGAEAVHFLGGGPTRFQEIRHTIRLGLLGGNCGKVDGEDITVSPIAARELIETYVDARPIAETLPVAWAVLEAAIKGVSLKKKEPEPPRKRATATTSSKKA